MEQPAVIGGGESVVIRVCIGIAAYPDDADSAGELAQLADAALYRAKAAGRDRIEFSRDPRQLSA
jgi:diguanylate cyclase (GGDEF)-like protein